MSFLIVNKNILTGYFEIQGTSEEILRHKLSKEYEAFQRTVLVDDTSIHFDELGGFPGPYIKDFIRAIPIYDIGVKFVGGRMQTVCLLGMYDGIHDIYIAKRTVRGDIVMPKNIDHGDREFDLFFQVDGTDKPMITLP